MNEKRLGVGRTYDLHSLFERLNRLYFDSTLSLIVRWSPRTNHPAATQKVVLGTYHVRTKTITLSRRLDHPLVPLFFVEHILFHEMLHAVFPSEKHRMHTPKFKKFERLHPDYERALEWEKASTKILFQKADARGSIQAQFELPLQPAAAQA